MAHPASPGLGGIIISSTKGSCARLSIDAEFIETPPEKRNFLELVILWAWVKIF